MKRCFKCGVAKELNNFYKHPQMADGHVNKCKECNKKDVRDNRNIRIDYYREYDKARANNPDRVNARLEYQKSDPGKVACKRAKIKYVERNIIKRAAHIMFGNAVRDGRIQKKDNCESCGIFHTRIHGHHDDYSKPFEVRWLCPKCHSQWHKENGSGLNG